MPRLKRHLLSACLAALAASASFAAHAADTPSATVVRFAITGYDVKGNSLLPEDVINASLAPYVGADRDFGDIQRAVEALEDEYHRRGYAAVVVLLPEQKLNAGRVRLDVLEGKIVEIRVKNASPFDEANILRALPALRLGEVPNADRLSGNMALANESPVKQTTLLLKAGDKDGDLIAEVNATGDRDWRVMATADNSGTRATGMGRVGLGLQHGNLFNRDHVLTLQYLTSPERMKDIDTKAIGYRIPFYSVNGALDAFVGRSTANVGNVSGLFNVSGSGDVFGLHYTQGLDNLGAIKQKLNVGIDVRQFKNSVIPIGQGTSVVPDYSVAPFSLTYTGDMESMGFTGSVYASYSRNTGLRALAGGNSDGAAMEAARTGAKLHYDVYRAGLNATWQLPADWRLRAQASGQYASAPLVPGEQFGLGGAASVRGFDERAIADDRGVRGSLELYTPDVAALMKQTAINMRFLAFYDAGRVSRLNAQSGEALRDGIASAGVGLRIASGRNLSFGIDYGYVLEGSAARPDHTGRFHVSLALAF